MIQCSSFEEGVDWTGNWSNGGMGHTSALYTTIASRTHHYFGTIVKTGRVLINMPSSQGAIGDIYNFGWTLSDARLRSGGGNSIIENVGVKT